MAWVRSLGYQQYETLLVQAGFDSLRAAQHLDDEALQQCGVVPLGHRRVLSAAAAALRADRAAGEELEARQLLQLRLHQQQFHGFPSPAPSPSPARPSSSARTPSPVPAPRLPSSASAASPTTAGSSPRGRASSRSQSPSGQGQRGGQTPPGPSPTRPDHCGAGSAEGMRGLFGDLFEPQRMYSPHKPISASQFDTVNDLLGCIVGPDRSPAAAAAAAAAAAKPPPRPQQP